MSLATAIAKDRDQPSKVRIGVVSSVSPFLVSVQGTEYTSVGLVGGYMPLLGDVVALVGQSAIAASGSSWLCLGPVSSTAGSEIGTNYWTGGTMASGASGSGAAGAETGMTGAWSGTINFTFPPGGLFSMQIDGVIFANVAVFVNGTARIRKDNIAGTVLWRYDQGIAPNSLALSQCFEYTSWLRNDTAEPVTCTLFLTAQRQASGGAGNWSVYGDTNTPLIVTVDHVGPTSAFPARAAIAVQV